MVHVAERIRADASSGTRDRPARHDGPEPKRVEGAPPERIAIAAIASGGAPLADDVRAEMEARLGGDFSEVRVHTSDAAAASADALGAEAYTFGNDVVFARGAFAPHDPLGRLRLAHELTHVVQQQAGDTSSAPMVSDPAEALEQAAEASARTALGTPSAPMRRAARGAPPARPVIQRRAVLDRSPAEQAASDAAAESPWLGMTAPGMIDFRTATPTVTPDPLAATRDAPPSSETPDGELDPLARPERAPADPPRTAPAPEESSNEGALTAERTAARAVAETRAEFREQPADHRPADEPPVPAAEPHAAGSLPDAAPAPGPGASGPAQPGQPRRDGTVELQLPKFPDESAAEFAVLIAADRTGQLGLQAAVRHALADVAAMMDRESARVDADLATAESTITAAIHTARGRVQGSAASARARVDHARTDQGARATNKINATKAAARTDVEKVAHNVEDVGSRRADEAQGVSDHAADALERSRDGHLHNARRTGDDKAGTAYSYAEEPDIQRASMSAQRQAAHEVAEQTAHEIETAINASTSDLRGGGPRLHSDVAERLRPVTTNVRNQIDPIERTMSGAATQLATGLDGGVTSARQTIETATRGLLAALSGIERQTKRQLRTAAETAKTGLRQAQADGERQLHEKQTEFVEAAHRETQQQLHVVSSRPVRRMLARRLANELRAVLRSGYGMGAQQANQIAGRIASQLSGALAQFHQEIAASTQPAVSGADSTAHSAGQQLGQIERHVVEVLSRTVTDALAGIDANQTRQMDQLGQTPDTVNQQLQGLVDQTRTRVSEDAGRLNQDASEKLGNLDERVDQAMTKARDKAELGAFGAWLMDQLRALGRALITPSFWVGLLVGLLITIFIVATFGSGAVVLIIAGVVAGAVSAAAAYTAQIYLDPLVDPHPPSPRREFSAREMGYQMLIGGIAGGIGALAGGAATGAVNRIVADVAGRAVVNRVAQTVVGAALGAVQNCMTGPDGGVHWQWHGEKWDEGLLTNLAVSTAMSSHHVEERISGLQGRARATMVDRGLAYNVTPQEHAQAQTRMFERAGVTEPGAPRAPSPSAVPDLSGVRVEVTPIETPPPPIAAPADVHPSAAPPPAIPTTPVEPHLAAPVEVRPAAPTETRAPTSGESRPPAPAEVRAPAPGETRPPTPAEVRPPAPGETRPPTPAEARPPARGEARPAAAGERRPPPLPAEARRTAEPVAGAPQREGAPRPGAPDRPHGPAPHEPQLIDLPDHTVMSGETPMPRSEAQLMYENSRRDAPHSEVGIFRNIETGEHIVIQGNGERVDSRVSRNAALREFLESRPGQSAHWELVEHSHPVDPHLGVTPEAQRLPSGRNGDFDVARHDSLARGGVPVEQHIGVVTERGNERVSYGYDPNHERPYSLSYPGPDGHPVTERFRSMEAYGEWYENHPGTGGGTPHIEGGEAGVAHAPPKAGTASGPLGEPGNAPAGRAGRGPGRQVSTPPPLPTREGVAAPLASRETAGGAPGAAPVAQPAVPAEHLPIAAGAPAPPTEHATAPISARPDEHVPGMVTEIRPEDHAAATASEPATTSVAADARDNAPGQRHENDPPNTYRDRKGRLRGARGRFVSDPQTAARQEIAFPAEKGPTETHNVTSEGAQTVQDAQRERNDAQARNTAARERVRGLAQAQGITPESLIRSNERQATLQRLRMQGISAQERGQLLHAEQARARAANRLNRASERLGMVAGEDVLRAGQHEVVSGSSAERGRPGEADLIGVSRGGDRLRVIEAKGGSAELGSGRIMEDTGLRAQQGSPEYLNDLLHRDPQLREYLTSHPEFARALAEGRVQVDYHLVSARPDGSIHVTTLRTDLRPGALQLGDLAPILR